MNMKMRRSLHDLRTLGGRVTDAERPQRRFVRLALLEMEKARRTKEKQRSSGQIDSIDRRLAEIESEQAQLLAETAPSAVRRTDAPQEQPAPPPSSMTITY